MKESYREGVASHPGPQPCEGGRQRETALGPAESQTPGMRRNSLRENRETPWLPVAKARRAGGRTR